MRRFLLAALLVLAVPANAQDKFTPAEKYMTDLFTKANAAIAYDQVCNDGKLTVKTKNENLAANIRALAKKTFDIIKANQPAKDDNGIGRMVTDNSKAINQRARELLKEKGCASEEGETFKGALEAMSENDPAAFDTIIKDDMTLQGIAE